MSQSEWEEWKKGKAEGGCLIMDCWKRFFLYPGRTIFLLGEFDGIFWPWEEVGRMFL